jgi:ABC-type transport system involved in multi-copper enzyme maturation permease subunit
MQQATNALKRIKTISAVGLNTFREAIRDRILYNLIVFALLITAAAIILGDLTNGQEARTIVNLSTNAILLFGVFIAIFVGIGLVSKEIEKRTVYSIFSKPIHRADFLLGKFFGLALTLLVNTAIMAVGVLIALWWVGGLRLAVPALGAIVLIYFEFIIITAIALVFSTFSSPALSALLTFLIFVIGHLTASLRELGELLGSTAAKYLLNFLYYVLPNLALFSFRTEAALGITAPMRLIAYDFAYMCLYSAAMLIIAIAVFRSRNFK